MKAFIEEIKAMTTEYGVQTSDLIVTLAIAQFETIRNYPSSWNEEKKLSDMKKNKAKIAMAVIEIDSKDGAENQTQMSENGISRTWADHILAYRDVIGYANVL